MPDSFYGHASHKIPIWSFVEQTATTPDQGVCRSLLSATTRERRPGWSWGPHCPWPGTRDPGEADLAQVLIQHAESGTHFAHAPWEWLRKQEIAPSSQSKPGSELHSSWNAVHQLVTRLHPSKDDRL